MASGGPAVLAERLVQTLQTVFGLPSFRSIQHDVTESTLAGHDVVALMPTGGGKSICFQLPAMVEQGTTVAFSPLLALVSNMVRALREKYINVIVYNSDADEDERASCTTAMPMRMSGHPCESAQVPHRCQVRVYHTRAAAARHQAAELARGQRRTRSFAACGI